MRSKPYLTPKLKKDIDHWIAKFPEGKQQSAVIMALRLAQKAHGYLPDTLLDEVAEYLDMAPIHVYKVASFYSMYERRPCGKHKLAICNSISCALKGSVKLIGECEKALGIKLGQTTQDGLITLKETECLGACANAPVAVLDEDQYQENLDIDACMALFEKFRSQIGAAKDD